MVVVIVVFVTNCRKARGAVSTYWTNQVPGRCVTGAREFIIGLLTLISSLSPPGMSILMCDLNPTKL